MAGSLLTRKVALLGLVLSVFALGLGYKLNELGVFDLEVVEAQENPDPKDTAACPGSNTVQEFTDTGNLETDLFDISTDRFIISYEFRNVEQGVRLYLFPSVENERGEIINANVPLINIGDEPPPANTGEFVVNATPGRYKLRIMPSSPDREYVVRVEECGDPSSGGSTDSSPSPQPSPEPPQAPPPSPSQPRDSNPPPDDDPPDRGTLMNAGGPETGPVPIMPSGECPREFPNMHNGACYPTSRT